MTANEVLVYLLEREEESFLKALRRFPEDKLDWTPAEGARSARDQAQEVATIVTEFWEIYSDRKLAWDEERWAAYLERRSMLQSLDEIEAALRASTAKLAEHVRTLASEEFLAPTEMPFPGEHRVLDNVHYHLWNMSYHEGVLNSYLMMLGVDMTG